MQTSTLPLTSPAKALSRDQLIHESWRRGRLRWLLRPHQKPWYDKYRAWERLPSATQPGTFARIFVLDVSKRSGKTTFRVDVRFEDCLRNPGHSYRYVTAFQKDIEEIVDDVAQALLDTCPAEFRPEYKLANKAQPAGFYFKNGSVLKTAGLDKNPDGLRGRASDGDDISEAVFIRHLRYTAKNVLYHQYQGRPHARMCMESSAPLEPDSEYDEIFVADAKLRGAYIFSTIDENTALSHEEREEFIRAAGGREHPDCRREYFCERVRDPSRAVIPEFLAAKHVHAGDDPEYAHCYVSLDPGMRDLCALLWAHWDAERGKLVVVRDWAERNAGTKAVADVIAATEAELWAGLPYYDGKELQPNPLKRVSDTDLRLIYDLRTEHAIAFLPTAKDDKQAALYALRNAFRNGQIEIRPNCVKLIAHLNAARWNDQRTDYERSETLGHCDLVDALVYMWRNVDKNADPRPPTDFGLTPKTHWFSPKAPVSTVPSQYREIANAWPGFKAGGM